MSCIKLKTNDSIAIYSYTINLAEEHLKVQGAMDMLTVGSTRYFIQTENCLVTYRHSIKEQRITSWKLMV